MPRLDAMPDVDAPPGLSARCPASARVSAGVAGSYARRRVPGRASLLLVPGLALLLSACCPDEDGLRAVNAINDDFKADYDRLVGELGTREFDLTPTQAYIAAKSTLSEMGMTVSAEDPAAGYLRGEAQAPLPLNDEEWTRAAKADGPRFRKHVVEHCGIVGHFYEFQPDRVNLIVDVLAVPAGAKTSVSITILMRFKEQRADLPPRSYPPPTGLKLGLEKFWSTLERFRRSI